MARLEKLQTEVINRRRHMKWLWQGEELQAYQGDTLASALLANGKTHVGRSFKYGRIRGIFSCGVEEPNALINLESGGYQTPNIKATEVSIYPNLQASPATDLKPGFRNRISALHRFMPAGFYYKTFMAPAKLWPWYEKKIRQLAGFATSPQEPDAETYDHQYHYYDIVIIGAGASGMAAAIEAAKHTQSVCLINEIPQLGGELRGQNGSNNKAMDWLQKATLDIEGNSAIDVYHRTTAFAWHDHNCILALQQLQDHLAPAARNPAQVRQRLQKIRAATVVLATGSHERPLIFSNNDLPGIMLASSVQRYTNEFAVACGSNIVIAGNNNSIYQVALDLHNKYKNTIHIADIRSKEECLKHADKEVRKTLQALSSVDIAIHWQHTVASAQGRDAIELVRLRHVQREGDRYSATSQTIDIECDLLVTSGGFNPLVHLDCHTGAKPTFDKKMQAFLPVCAGSDREAAGSVAGYNHWQACIASGTNAAKKLLGKATASLTIDDSNLATAPFYIANDLHHAFIDMQNDVTVADIELAIRENYQSIEHIKRYTALGFGTDQGKTSNVNGIAVAAKVLGKDISEIGTTTFRPAYTPVAFGALAGKHKNTLFEPQRFTPIHQSHLNNNAQWELVGQWLRPRYFPEAGESMDQAVQRECLQVRQSVGMMDASTLGKIDIQGPDAREFLGRVYTNAWAKLGVGKCRYGLMCNEQGMIIDDGVTACLSDNHFLMTTTTGGAATIFSWLEMWLQTEWPHLQVWLTSVTDQWSTTAVIGPQARKVIKEVCSDVNFDNDSFPFMQWRAGTVCGIPARIMRISFSGELAYEINVQSNYGRSVWDSVAAVASQYKVTYYGTESMHVLRAEKGYIIVGQDTDGSVTPVDANMSWALANAKPFSYIGKRSLARTDLIRKDRKQLVGIQTKDPQEILPEGCQLVNKAGDTKMIGHVTSSYMSPVLQRSIALALVTAGLHREGETIYARPIVKNSDAKKSKSGVRTILNKTQPAPKDNKNIAVTIVSSTFYDIGQVKINGNS